MAKPPSRDQDKFIIRLPDGMREQIRAAADRSKRTMTGEIVARLERTFREDEPTPDARSKLAAQRILDMDLSKPAASEGADPEEAPAILADHADRIEALEEAVSGLTELLSETRKQQRLP